MKVARRYSYRVTTGILGIVCSVISRSSVSKWRYEISFHCPIRLCTEPLNQINYSAGSFTQITRRHRSISIRPPTGRHQIVNSRVASRMGLDMHSITMSSFGGDHAALHKAVFLSDNKSASAFFFFSQRQYLTISPLETVRQHLLKKKMSGNRHCQF